MLSTFFLANYQQFGESRRVGSFGFGSNETALFVTTLILFLIFNRSIRLFFNYIFVFIGIISLFIIASRRAYLLLVVLFLVISFFSRRRYKITFSLRGIVVFSILTTITIIILNLGLLNWLRDSNFVNRIFYFLNNDLSFIEVSSRLDIYRQAFISIIKRPILGYLGSDSLIASDAFSNTIHAHNIFIQMILKYGILIGIGINVFLLSTLYKSFVIIKSIHNRIKETIFPIFFIVYITFDLLGYMLWNPKGLMIVIMSVVFINTKYKELVKI
jgi:O-antigen ligase